MVRRLAPIPDVPLLGTVGAKVDAAVVDVGDPDVAVDVKGKVGAALGGDDLGRLAGVVVP